MYKHLWTQYQRIWGGTGRKHNLGRDPMSYRTSKSAWLEKECDREKGLLWLHSLKMHAHGRSGSEWRGFGRMVHLLNEPISSYLGQSVSQQMDRTIKPVTVLQQNTS